jgi:hypothetical protein
MGLVCGVTLLSLTPAAAGAIKINRIYFDSPGSDTGSNSSLNAEWIRLKNTGNSARQLQRLARARQGPPRLQNRELGPSGRRHGEDPHGKRL